MEWKTLCWSNTNNFFLENVKILIDDSTGLNHPNLIKTRPFGLSINERKNNENQKMISLTEYQKLKTQILSLDLINKMTDEEFIKIIEGKKIYIIDKIDIKVIKKVLVKNLAYVIPD